MGRLIDYPLACRTAAAVAPAGPQIGMTEAASVVNELRGLAVRAEEHVRAVTGMVPEGPILEATVVDRPGWARANIAGLEVVVEPVIGRLLDRQGRVSAAATSRVAAVQLGSVFGWLSSKVLGQYEVFLPPGEGAGRLVLVAPNIVEAERRLGVDPHDFRLWVALHEVTHRTQFTAVPWLHGHVRDEVQALLRATSLDDPSALVDRLRSVVTSAPGARSLMELLQTPEQKVILDRVTAFMSLLEGHAEHVMDGVGSSVVPTVADIRRRFDQRRKERGGLLDRALRRLLGLDLKALQYAEGARFVSQVVGEVGMPGFNRVWESPATLPSLVEIRDPARWVERVHATAASSTSA